MSSAMSITLPAVRSNRSAIYGMPSSAPLWSHKLGGTVPSIRIGEESGDKVHVFLSHRCGFCRRFWQDLDSYFAAGIAFVVHPFILAGPDSQELEEAVAIWCDLDKTEALLGQAYTGSGDIDADSGGSECTQEGVIASQRLGTQLGASATPVFVTAGGRMISGLVGPQRLRAAMDAAR